MAIGWFDSAERYGKVTRALHWVMAGILAWQFTGMILKLALGRAPVVSFFLGLHGPLGALLFVLAAVRIVWGGLSRERRPVNDSGLLGALARGGHVALYALMAIVPALALLRAWGSGRGFEPFGIPVFPATGVEVAWATAPGNALHGLLAWALLLLIAGHVLMVVVHQFVLRDDTAKRMISLH